MKARDDLSQSRQDGPAGALRDRGGAAPALRISRRKGSFLRPLHVRDFEKEGYFFVPRYEEWGLKIPLLLLSAAVKQGENYKILS